MSIAEELACRIAALDEPDLPQRARDNAKVVILDTLGCALAGASQPAVETLLRTPGLVQPGPASLIGRGERLAPLDAALVNGVAAHALDFDDVNMAMGGHPSAPILPALFALVEAAPPQLRAPVSGRDFLRAFITGFETETRLARSVNFHHYEKGWHPTATLGVFAAAAACSRLLGLEPGQIARALGLAASLACGIKANFGTMTKPFHIGNCTRNGLMCALLAGQGFTSSPVAFEHKQGFFNVFNGPGTYRPELVTANWAAPLDIVEPGIGIKLYPCCDSTHAAIDGLFTLKNQNGFSVSDVEEIDVLVHPLRLPHVNRPQIQSALDAKFSLQYCLARALLDGHIVLDSFTESAYRDPRIPGLMARVHAVPHPDLSQASEGNYLTDLTLHLSDGRTLHQHMDRPYGRHADEPPPRELLLGKFNNCATKALTAENAAALRKIVSTLEDVPDMTDVCRLFRAR